MHVSLNIKYHNHVVQVIHADIRYSIAGSLSLSDFTYLNTAFIVSLTLMYVHMDLTLLDTNLNECMRKSWCMYRIYLNKSYKDSEWSLAEFKEHISKLLHLLACIRLIWHHESYISGLRCLSPLEFNTSTRCVNRE